MTHALLTLILQLGVGVIWKRWLLGGLLASAFYLGREITQAEYRWISAFGEGRRANMAWWGGLDPRAWTGKSVVDVLLPVFVTLTIFVIAHHLRGWRQRQSSE